MGLRANPLNCRLSSEKIVGKDKGNALGKIFASAPNFKP